MGPVLLAGGAEFGELTGGPDSLVCIIPAAAAPDHNHKRASQNGIRWFQGLGAKNVRAVDVIDPSSANDPSLAAFILNSRLIYLLGGFPRHLAETLSDSLCWRAALDAHRQGAVIAGSSAGAMVLCEHYYDPYERKLLRGLNLIRGACVLPHHNNFGRAWADPLKRLIPESTLLGIDEGTGMVSDAEGMWQVYGAGEVTLYRGRNSGSNQSQQMNYKRGEKLSFQ